MNDKTKTQILLEAYLNGLDLSYTLTVSQSDNNLVFTVHVPKDNNQKIGILKGKMGQNIIKLQRILKVIASLEGFEPVIIIKLED